MIGDIVEVKKHHIPPANDIFSFIRDGINQTSGIYSLTVGGESGSGKSTLSLALKKVLEKQGHNTFIFHIDDYFKLPPEDNHEQRRVDISHVGPEEVNLDLLQKNIEEVRGGAPQIKKPLVHYRENQIREVIVELEDISVIIAEGTYCTLLDDIDCKIFMLRNYRDTYEARAKRGRDPMDPFIEKVLEIEHNILQDHIQMADILVDKEYNVQPQSEKFLQNKSD